MVEHVVQRMTEAAGSARTQRRILINGLELMASIGVFEVEKRYQQRIVVSVDLDVADDYDGHSERLDQVVDYAKIVAAIRALVEARHYQLIETLAERISVVCLDDNRVLKARIMVEKPDIMPGCRSVGVAIERLRNN